MIANPLDPTGGLASGLAAQAWQAAMLGLWNAGLWLLGLVLHTEDALLTPDLSGDGPAAGAYGLTLWMAAALGTVMLLAQLLLTLLRRDARSLGEALLGCGKFVVVWAGWVGWATAVVGVCGALTRAVLRSLLHIRSWSGWHLNLQASLKQTAGQAVDVTVATVLGLLGLVLWLAALGHMFVMLARAVTLLVLAATTPIAAAGLVGEIGRGWFWRSVRWFHAAALTPLLMALLLGIGVQTSTGVTASVADGPARAVATALPGALLILTSSFAPMALFRLLSFVEPNTPAGSSVRHLLSTVLQTGMLLGGPGQWASLASSSDDNSSTPSTTGAPEGPGAGDAAYGRQSDAESSMRSGMNIPAGNGASSSSSVQAEPAGPPAPPSGGQSITSTVVDASSTSGTYSSSPSPGPSTPSVESLPTQGPGRPDQSPSGSTAPSTGSSAATSGATGGTAGGVAGEVAALPVVPL